MPRGRAPTKQLGNYDADATEDDGSCETLDECNVCGGMALQRACDCDGNQLDALGGGANDVDADADGICIT